MRMLQCSTRLGHQLRMRETDCLSYLIPSAFHVFAPTPAVLYQRKRSGSKPQRAPHQKAAAELVGAGNSGMFQEQALALLNLY